MKLRIVLLTVFLAGCSSNQGPGVSNPVNPDANTRPQALSCDQAKEQIKALGQMPEDRFLKAIAGLSLPAGAALDELGRCLDGELSVRCDGQICEAKDLK